MVLLLSRMAVSDLRGWEMARKRSKCIPARVQTTRGLTRVTRKPCTLHTVSPATGTPEMMVAEEKKRNRRLNTELETPR